MGVIEYIGSIGGVAGVLAFLMFLIYRADHKTSEANLSELVKAQALQQANQLREYNETCREHTKAMVRQAEVQTELITWLQRANGQKAR